MPATLTSNCDVISASSLSGPTQPAEDPIELSVIMPCLNEEETVGICIRSALEVLRDHGIGGEVVIADNGSTDRSIEIAEAEGARVVRIEKKGYGNALKGGIQAARGKYVLMADSDDSYDFGHIPRFLAELRGGGPTSSWATAFAEESQGKPCRFCTGTSAILF